MLFHIVNDRHLSGRAMVFTTNKKLTDWGPVLHHQDVVAAIVDRLLERGRIIGLDGPSMRSRHLAPDDRPPQWYHMNRRQDFRNPHGSHKGSCQGASAACATSGERVPVVSPPASDGEDETVDATVRGLGSQGVKFDEYAEQVTLHEYLEGP